MKIALLVVDLQKQFFGIPKCRPFLDDALEHVNETIKLFRNASLPIIFIQDEEAGDGPGSEGYELYEKLLKKDTDMYLSKLYSNAFWKTDLEARLKQLKVGFLVICGFAAGHCVNFTYNGARERGFSACILQHGIAGFSKAAINFVHNDSPLISYEALKYLVKQA